MAIIDSVGAVSPHQPSVIGTQSSSKRVLDLYIAVFETFTDCTLPMSM